MDTRKIQEVDPALICRPAQVRTDFDEQALAELQASIAEVGILQPILVRLEEGKITVLDGERRIRAAITLGLKAVPVIFGEEKLDSAAVKQRQLIANTIRQDLSPLEQADAIRSMMLESGCTAGEVARKIAKSPATVSKLLSLLELPPDLRQRVASGEIGLCAGHELARSMRQDFGSSQRRQRLTAMLDAVRSVVTTGVEDTMEAYIHVLEELLSRTKAARKKGIELPTYLAMLRDQARLKDGSA
ncbi:MAG TPA: ParB/RepB/Spo0J family partition protein [Pirellulales bacterium]|jgi:ParB family chromosome partitioning protein